MFEAVGVEFGDVTFGGAGGVFDEGFGKHLVVAAFYFFHVGIDYRQVHFFGYGFGAFEDGGFLVEEGGPVSAFGHGGLVGDEDGAGEVVFVCQHCFDHGLHGDHFCTEAAAHAVHELVELFIGQGVVEHYEFLFAQYAEGMAGPLPVAKVAHDHDDAAAFGCVPVEKSKCIRVEQAVFQDTFFADGEYLECLDHKVAEVVVEGAGDRIDLAVGFLREGVAEVLEHYGFAVANAAVEDKV